jgi:hypothetical protein
VPLHRPVVAQLATYFNSAMDLMEDEIGTCQLIACKACYCQLIIIGSIVCKTYRAVDLGYLPPHMMYKLHALRVLCAFCGTGSTAGRPGA